MKKQDSFTTNRHGLLVHYYDLLLRIYVKSLDK